MTTAAITVGTVATHKTWGRFSTTCKVTVVRYGGCGLWTVRTDDGIEFSASESELSATPALPRED